MSELHRHMIAVSGVVVDHDGRGGTAPDNRVGSHGAGQTGKESSSGSLYLMLHCLVLVVSGQYSGPEG